MKIQSPGENVLKTDAARRREIPHPGGKSWSTGVKWRTRWILRADRIETAATSGRNLLELKWREEVAAVNWKLFPAAF